MCALVIPYIWLCASLLVPCWGALFSAGVHGGYFSENLPDAIPTFLIIGTAKGGTTDLYEQLADQAINQDTSRPDPPIIRAASKEFNFLAREYMEPSELVPGGTQFSAYLEKIGHPCANAAGDALKTCLQQDAFAFKGFTVDATPVNLFGPIAPVNLAHLSPSSKIIVMLRDPVERVEVLFRHVCIDEGQWTDSSVDALTDQFFSYLDSEPAILQALNALATCSDVVCMADGWRNMEALNWKANKEIKHFSGALYVYSLAMWRVHYFKPERVMVIDSHAYFRNRYSVVEKVIYFLYGRAMTPAEQAQARISSFWRKGPKALSRAGENWILSPGQRARLTAFYGTHVYKHLRGALHGMRRDGASIIGFDDDPWTTNPDFGLPP